MLYVNTSIKLGKKYPESDHFSLMTSLHLLDYYSSLLSEIYAYALAHYTLCSTQ